MKNTSTTLNRIVENIGKVIIGKKETEGQAFLRCNGWRGKCQLVDIGKSSNSQPTNNGDSTK